MEGFEIRISDGKKGKGLFATKQFNEGDVILEEDPLVSCQFAWNQAYRYLACDHCMRPLETPEQNVRRLSAKPDIVLPHSDCFETDLLNITSCNQCGILYCSEDCKENSFATYHRTLCYIQNEAHHPINTIIETWKQIHYPPETANIMLLLRILAYIQQHSDPEAAAATVKQFCHRTVNEDAELVHKLLGDKFTSQIHTLREMTANVISGDHVQEFLTPEGFCSLMALVGTNGQGIGTSPLSLWVTSVSQQTMSDDERQQLDVFIDKLYQYVEEESGQFLNTEGSGLFQLQSACNHSCAPDAEVSFPYGNHRLQLKALKTIMPGEEICISYLDECSLQRSRHSRQKPTPGRASRDQPGSSGVVRPTSNGVVRPTIRQRTICNCGNVLKPYAVSRNRPDCICDQLYDRSLFRVPTHGRARRDQPASSGVVLPTSNGVLRPISGKRAICNCGCVLPSNPVFISPDCICEHIFDISLSSVELAINYLFLCCCVRCTCQRSDPDCTSEEEMSDQEIDSDD